MLIHLDPEQSRMRDVIYHVSPYSRVISASFFRLSGRIGLDCLQVYVVQRIESSACCVLLVVFIC
jgi:hypothetical protein